MIKITRAEYQRDKVIQLHFFDGSWGDYDLLCLTERKAELSAMLQDDAFFKQFYLEMGALCWHNGFELSSGNIHLKLQAQHKLHRKVKVA